MLGRAHVACGVGPKQWQSLRLAAALAQGSKVKPKLISCKLCQQEELKGGNFRAGRAVELQMCLWSPVPAKLLLARAANCCFLGVCRGSC